MLSGARARSSRRRGSGPVFALEPHADGLRLHLAGVEVVATAEGALWVETQRALIVSDLHLEKGSSLARGGRMLPPYDTRSTLTALEAVIARRNPQVVVALGDSFHDPGGPSRMAQDDLERLRMLMRGLEWIWVEGNHDGAAPASLGGRACGELSISGLVFRHEPQPAPQEGEVAGHLHPCARVLGTSGAVRRRCFATDGRRLVLPAMGAFAGGLNVRDIAFAPLFPEGCCALALSRGRVLPAGWGRLAPD